MEILGALFSAPTPKPPQTPRVLVAYSCNRWMEERNRRVIGTHVSIYLLPSLNKPLDFSFALTVAHVSAGIAPISAATVGHHPSLTTGVVTTRSQ